MTTKLIQQWTGALVDEAVDCLGREGGLVVSPTKVGYILMANDGQGLERKFSAKQRKRNKPGVVLCADVEHVLRLAEVNPEIERLYAAHWEQDVLLGCILPWREDAIDLLPDDTARELAMDSRGTSCFVIRFGRPSEQIVAELWRRGRLTFASSANPSGVGNCGRVSGIGDRIAAEADVIIGADDFVASIQPEKDEHTRHEQGVMVSMVDREGKLVPVQDGARSVTPAPVLIRKGLDYERVMRNLSDIFNSWDYRHGEYY
jgi:tRNA A37 threonylcarbamoyladenosine synthetase subunit TsaC/SUA5/YrdC